MPHKVVTNEFDDCLLHYHSDDGWEQSWLADIANDSRDGDLESVKDRIALWKTQQWATSFLTIPLNAAAQQGRTDVVRYLVSEGAPRTGDSIRLAAEAGSIPCLKIFIDSGWDVNQPLSANTPPVLAYALRNESLTTWLLDRGADPNARCETDYTPLSCAVQLGLTRVVHKLLVYGGNVEKGQLVHCAVERQSLNMELLDEIVGKGAPLDDIRFSSSEHATQTNAEYLLSAIGFGTPLHTAIGARNIQAIRYLLERGADVEKPDLCQRTPHQFSVEMELPSDIIHELASGPLNPRKE